MAVIENGVITTKWVVIIFLVLSYIWGPIVWIVDVGGIPHPKYLVTHMIPYVTGMMMLPLGLGLVVILPWRFFQRKKGHETNTPIVVGGILYAVLIWPEIFPSITPGM
jgi:hypothetical protein